jgi:hypothetical protein
MASQTAVEMKLFGLVLVTSLIFVRGVTVTSSAEAGYVCVSFALRSSKPGPACTSTVLVEWVWVLISFAPLRPSLGEMAGGI